jgi:hypothetical protein
MSFPSPYPATPALALALALCCAMQSHADQVVSVTTERRSAHTIVHERHHPEQAHL